MLQNPRYVNQGVPVLIRLLLIGLVALIGAGVLGYYTLPVKVRFSSDPPKVTFSSDVEHNQERYAECLVEHSKQSTIHLTRLNQELGRTMTLEVYEDIVTGAINHCQRPEAQDFETLGEMRKCEEKAWRLIRDKYSDPEYADIFVGEAVQAFESREAFLSSIMCLPEEFPMP